MAITITIDNDPVAAGTQTLANDQSAGTQTPATTDTGNDSDLGITDATVAAGNTPDSNNFDGSLTGANYSASFLSFLNATTIFGSGTLRLTDAQKAFAANVDGAVSSSTFVSITTSAGEVVNDLFFSDSAGNPLSGQQVAGMHTLDGGNVYLYSMGDYAIATTSATAGAGRVVAAFYLNEAGNHLSAQVQMATFEPLAHPDTGNPDDALNFTDLLQVSAAGTLSFDFDNLPSGNFLYAAVGSAAAGIMVTGRDLNVQAAGTAKAGDIITGGAGGDPSDTVNTSQGGQGATIGVNNQMFAAGKSSDGSTGVFTLVKGFTSFDATINGTSEGTGTNITEIGYSDYINAPSAGIFISQISGSTATFKLSLWEAGGGGVDKAPNQLTTETSYNYLGDHVTDSALNDDWAVNVGSISVTRGSTTYTWGVGGVAFGTAQGGINVTLDASHANTVSFTGIHALDTINFAAANDPLSNVDGTFNRFDIQALAGSDGFDVGRIDLSQGVSVAQGVGSDLIVQDDGPSIMADATNAPAIQDDETTLGTNNHANYAANFTAIFGTDGAGSTARSYALSTGGGDSGVVDTATGLHVFLFKIGDNIVGKAGTDSANAAANNIVVFVVSVDQTGEVTLDQQRAIVHPDTGNFDESKGLTGSNLVVLTATAYDGDGDHASAPLDISGLLSFKDDGIAIAVNANTPPPIQDDETNLGVNNHANYAADFTVTLGADGAGATPRSYALSTPGGDSGVVDTATGLHVFLFQVGDNIVGKAGTDSANAAANNIVVFVVSVTQAGEVTLDQQRAIVHPDTGNFDESKGLTGSNLVVLTATAYDGDGDHAAAPLDLTGLLSFKDDGIAIAANANTRPPIQDDETNLGINNHANYAADFTVTLGADGAGATPRSYALSTPGGDSGVVDTATNQHVYLFQVGDTIVGKAGTDSANAQAGSTVVFVISVDQTGEVTLDQQRAIVHPDTTNPDDSKGLTGSNLVVLTATAYDGDGDHASAPLDLTGLLSFKDDGPSMVASATGAPSITDDESFLGTNNTGDFSGNFTPTFGADGAGSTPRSYALSTPGGDSGLIESGTGLHVFLFKVGDNIVGKAGSSLANAQAGSDVVFVVSTDQNGVVTLDQQKAVVHDPNNGVNQTTSLSSAGLVVLTATAYDGDGDHASDFLNIGQLLNFADDAPTITAQILNGEVTFAQGSSVSHSLNGSIGADGTSALQTSLSGTAEFAISYWDTPTNVYPNLNAVLSANGTVLTYYSDAADTNAVYRLTLDPLANSGHGGYTFDVLAPPPIVSTNFGFTDLPSGQNLDAVIATDKADLTKGGLLVFPSNPVLNPDGTYTNTSGTINTSKGGGPVTIGNGNQAFDSAQEGAYFMYVDNPAAASVGGLGLTQTTADDADTIRFNGLNQSTDSSVSIVQASGAGTDKRPGPVMHIFTWEAASSTAVTSDAAARLLVNNPVTATGATEVSIVGIKIHDSTGKVVEYGVNNNGTTVLQDVTGDHQVTAADNAGSVISFINDNAGGTAVYSAIVTQLKAGYTIEFLTSSDHNIALVQNVSGSFDIGGFSASNQSNIPQQDFHFATTITDYDNDAYGGHLATYADWSVTLDAVTFP